MPKSKTKTTCYKCEVEIEIDYELAVHPMCDECQSDFEDWFSKQLAVFGK
jgi:hypothetical protein